MNRKIRIDAENLREQQAKRAEKEALIAQKKKEKEKRKSSIFSGWGGSSNNKNANDEDDDLQQNYEDEEEIHSLQITSKRNEAHRRETEQLFFGLSGAQIFFKRTDVDI